MEQGSINEDAPITQTLIAIYVLNVVFKLNNLNFKESQAKGSNKNLCY